MSGTTTYDALDWSVANCPIGRAMEILGERWTVVVLREVFSGIRRFDDLRVRTDIPRQVLSNRLGKLVEHGILRRTPYRQPGARQRYEYRLTQQGLDLYPVLIAIVVEHRDCGAPVHTELHCESGHALTSPRDAVPRPGPGARRRTNA
jgi:DNA-binding HxlR family transcriptional regulator